MPSSRPVAVVNLGCRVNRVELDAIAASLEAAGCQLVGQDEAEAVVVNTCAVTGEAEAKARKAVRHAALLPRHPLVVATGCVASLFSDELAALAPKVLVEPDKTRVAGALLASMGWDKAAAGTCSIRAQTDDPSAVVTVGDMASVTPTGRMRPGLKVQDGCDNRCTYCIVWKARGPARSVGFGEVLKGVRDLVARGAREVVLTGIDLGRYDSDGRDLAGLVSGLLEQTGVERLRLSSVEPAGVTPRLLDVMAQSDGRVAPFLHIPLQAGCSSVLRRMGRPYDTDGYLSVVNAARARVDGLALACDLIVGFPGETDEEFERGLAFCHEVGFANMHVFRYSRRPGTPAASMPDQVLPEVSAARAGLMRDACLEGRARYVASRVGSEELVLVEREGRGVSGGLVDVLVDDGLRGRLVRVTPHATSGDFVLDARSAR